MKCFSIAMIDKTGLEGKYDFDLKIKPENAPDDPRFDNLLDLFTAVQEQLGLKLVPQRVAVEYLVIDHADRVPIEN